MMTSRTALSFDEWFEHGYRVKKGMKSGGRNSKGAPTFTLKQVWLVPENKRSIFLKPPSNEPPKEITKALKEKEAAEEEKHLYIDTSFDVTDQKFEDDEEPPW
jgi:hypothetical protein